MLDFNKPIKYLILGAGPCGLGAAYELQKQRQSNYLVCEALDSPGGLASSFVDEKGFTWDIGGHVQFSHYDYFDKAMDEALGKEGWVHHDRESWVWMKDRFIPYPFQNNIHYLSQEDQARCLEGLETIQKKTGKIENFYDWLTQSFGRGICELFLYPYNFKVWAYPPEQMNYQWIAERVATVDLERIKENIRLARDDVSWGPNNKFRFPLRGGTGSIWKSIAKNIPGQNIQYSLRAEKVNMEKKKVTFSNGKELAYENLLSTLPLDKLIERIEDLPADLQTYSKSFKYSSSHIVGVGIKGQPSTDLASKCWMYFPEKDCPFYRVTLFSKYSPYNVPDFKTQFSLMTETSESSQKTVNHSSLVEETIQGLRNTGLLKAKDEVVSTWLFTAKHGYPTPFLGRDKILNTIQPYLDERNISSRGRFGGWKYEVSNQDHTFMQGVEWVKRKTKNQPETTYQYEKN